MRMLASGLHIKALILLQLLTRAPFVASLDIDSFWQVVSTFESNFSVQWPAFLSQLWTVGDFLRCKSHPCPCRSHALRPIFPFGLTVVGFLSS